MRGSRSCARWGSSSGARAVCSCHAPRPCSTRTARSPIRRSGSSYGHSFRGSRGSPGHPAAVFPPDRSHREEPQQRRSRCRGEPMSPRSQPEAWPDLPYAAWKETCATLHLWTQIVGKVRLARTPWLNHSWHVPLYVTTRGLTTSPIPYGQRSFEIAFDFNEHVLEVTTSDGARRRMALEPQTVADFYGAVMSGLTDFGIPVRINEFPYEIPGAVPFSRDRAHAAYDAEYAQEHP